MAGINVPQWIQQRRAGHPQPPDGARFLFQAVRQCRLVELTQLVNVAGKIETIIDIAIVRRDADVSETDRQTTTLSVPARLKRTGKEMRIVVSDGSELATPDTSLVRLLVR